MEMCPDTLALMCEASVGTGLSGRSQSWLLIGLVLIMRPKALPRLFVMMRALAGRGHTFFIRRRERKTFKLPLIGCNNLVFSYTSISIVQMILSTLSCSELSDDKVHYTRLFRRSASSLFCVIV